MEQYQAAPSTLNIHQRTKDLSGDPLCGPGAPPVCITPTPSLSVRTMMPRLHGPDELLAPYSEGSWEEQQTNISSCTVQPLYLDGWLSVEYGAYSDLAQHLGMAPDGGDVSASYPSPVSSGDIDKPIVLTCPEHLQTDYAKPGAGVTTTIGVYASESESESESEGDGEGDSETEVETGAKVGNYTKGPQIAFQRCGPDFGLERRCTVFTLAETDKSSICLETVSQLARRVHVCQYPLSTGADGRTCQTSFVRPEHLRRHVKTVHGESKEFLCKVASCMKAFTRSDNLRGHYWTHVEREGRPGTNEKMSLARLSEILGRKERRLMRRLKKRLAALTDKE